MICDFCGSPDIKWHYPAKTFIMNEPVKTFYKSFDGWMACDECSNLIERGEKEKLTDRCIKVYEEQECPLQDREISKLWLSKLHQSFWDNRIGEREVLA